MERKIEKQLISWKQSSNRMPLIVSGARQVGKTFTILSFGKTYYKNVAYFNFESNLELQQIFERDLSPERIIRELSAKSGKSLLEGETLIFFDEIQACERALTSLKYFCEEAPMFHVIAAGSLLGVVVNREKFSFPVGKVDRINLYPLDFEEFLWALNLKQGSDIIRESYEQDQKFSLHQTYLDHYKTYLVVGGMPQVVNEYINQKDFNFVLALQKNINDAYVADMAKYATPAETTKIMGAYNSVPSQLAKENRKFQYKFIKSGARASDFEAPLDWLQAAGVIQKCTKINEGKLPLSAYAVPESFKVYLSDSGLLCSKYGISPNFLMSESLGFENIKGALAENHVMISLSINGYKPYYWESQGKAELDFVIQKNNGDVLPIEVKSSENVKSKSLNQFITKYNPPYSIRVSTKNFGFENGIKSVPLYATFCI
jgi:predicted AAA+ superfamily ATPase